MTLLLDTHALLWFLEGNARLGVEAKQAIGNAANRVLVSPAGIWEISIKDSLGKLRLPESFEDMFPRRLVENPIEWLPIELAHLKVH